MTDRALDDLIAAVEAGTLPEAIFHGCSVVRDHWAYKTGLTADQRNAVFLAYNGSLDAAKSLHEALLPGWQRQISESNAKVWERQNIAFFGEVVGNDARAWLIAILRAYREMQG